MRLDVHAAQEGSLNLPLHLVEEINHRVANEYAEAIAGLSLAATAAIELEVRQALRHAAERLHAHAETHRALLPPADGLVNLADYIGGLCASFSRATLADRRVHLSVDTEEIWLASDRAWRLGLAVAELIRNAARHGLRGREGAIGVRIAGCGDEVVCVVCDDGTSPPAPRPGRGVGLVRALAAELSGSVDWRFGTGGCTARLRAPVLAAAA